MPTIYLLLDEGQTGQFFMPLRGVIAGGVVVRDGCAIIHVDLQDSYWIVIPAISVVLQGTNDFVAVRGGEHIRALVAGVAGSDDLHVRVWFDELVPETLRRIVTVLPTLSILAGTIDVARTVENVVGLDDDVPVRVCFDDALRPVRYSRAWPQLNIERQPLDTGCLECPIPVIHLLILERLPCRNELRVIEVVIERFGHTLILVGVPRVTR